jgi:Family of unknown function (DUF5754)
MYRKLSVVRRKAKELSIEGKIENSDKKNKRFMITLVDGTVIHFGQWLYKGRGAFIDHHDEKIKTAWKARHSKIMLYNEPAYLNIYSPSYYSWNLLW